MTRRASVLNMGVKEVVEKVTSEQRLEEVGHEDIWGQGVPGERHTGMLRE